MSTHSRPPYCCPCLLALLPSAQTQATSYWPNFRPCSFEGAVSQGAVIAKTAAKVRYRTLAAKITIYYHSYFTME